MLEQTAFLLPLLYSVSSPSDISPSNSPLQQFREQIQLATVLLRTFPSVQMIIHILPPTTMTGNKCRIGHSPSLIKQVTSYFSNLGVEVDGQILASKSF